MRRDSRKDREMTETRQGSVFYVSTARLPGRSETKHLASNSVRDTIAPSTVAISEPGKGSIFGYIRISQLDEVGEGAVVPGMGAGLECAEPLRNLLRDV